MNKAMLNNFGLFVSHIDTCLSCYVQDHCNGENEELFGVAVDGSMRVHHVKAALISEVHATVNKMPDGANYEAAIIEAFSGVHPFKTFDSSLEPASAYEDGESVYAYFRFSWDIEETADDEAESISDEEMELYRSAAMRAGWTHHVARMTGTPSFHHADHGYVIADSWQEICESYGIETA